MSEPRRWNLVAEGLILAVSGGPSVSLQEAEKGIPVIEAEPALARIKQLETQLKEANEVAEFYGNEKNWKARTSGHGDQTFDSVANDCKYGGTAGERAREYLRKKTEERE